MNADILRDYMLSRLNGTQRERVRNRLRVDPSSRDRLRRLRNTSIRVRARVGRVDTVRQLPREWLTLVERVALRTRAAEAEPPKTWLRSGVSQNGDRTLTWL